jgi:hypothetical protein
LEEEDDRGLNRKTDNMANFDNHQELQHEEEEDQGYGDEIINQEDSSNFNVEQHE